MSVTGTGPFTITGAESTLAIYNSVVAANSGDAYALIDGGVVIRSPGFYASGVLIISKGV